MTRQFMGIIVVLVIVAAWPILAIAQGDADPVERSQPRLEKVTRFTVDDTVRDVVLLPQPTRCVLLLENKTAELWDVEFGARLKSFQSHDGIWAIASSADGRFLWGHSSDKFEYPLVRWDIAAGNQVDERPTGTSQAGVPIRAIADNVLVFATQPRPIRLDVAAGKRDCFEGDLCETCVEVWDMDMSRDGRLMVTAHYYGGFVALWSVEYKQLLRKFEAGEDVRAGSGPSKEPKDRLQSVCSLSPDGRRVLSVFGPDNPSILVWDARTGDRVATLSLGKSSGIGIARFSGDGAHVLSSGAKGSLLLWDVAKASVLARTPETGSEVRELKLSQDGTRAIAAHEDRSVTVWTIAVPKQDNKSDSKGTSSADRSGGR